MVDNELMADPAQVNIGNKYTQNTKYTPSKNNLDQE